jgi:hypothetical protein
VNEYIKSDEQLVQYLTGDIQYYSSNERYYNNYEGCRDTMYILISCVDNYKARKIFDQVFRGSYENLSDVTYIDTGNEIGDKLTGQTIIGFRKGNFENNSNNYTHGKFVPDIKLQPVSSFFPQILTEEDKEEEPTCGDTNDTNVQNLGANITSATITFNALNNILCFDSIPAKFSRFDAREGYVTKIR